MPLDPSLNVDGNPDSVKVSATDVATSPKCGRFLVLKTRPSVKVVDGWRRLFAPWGEGVPVPVVAMVDLIAEAHGHNFGTYEAQARWLADAIMRRKIHRLLRPYISLAVDNILEAHESIEAELGSLRLLAENPWIGTWNRQLAAWGPLYETADGIREIRRFRHGAARRDEESERWSLIGAYVAATYGQFVPSRRVRVIEIGALDGSSAAVFDGTAADARANFLASGRDLASAAAEDDHVAPCRSCGDCKAAGRCRALIPVDAMLGQSTRGLCSRSVSAGELEQYARCPAQWLLASGMHLPREEGDGEGAARGRAVHRWLQVAHSRRAPCTSADLPVPGSGLGLAEGVLTEAEYETAYPFLLQHAGRCPLADETSSVVLVDQNIYGYDHDAEVVPVIRPDLLFRAGDRLVIREFKTAERPYESGRDEAYDRHLQVAFAIAMLNSGLLARYGAGSGMVELELLTSSDRFVWTWDADDPAVALVAAGTVRRAVADWHEDKTWNTQPGPYCAWCPVRRWCPDNEVWQNVLAKPGQDAAVSPGAVPVLDEPPF
jgi:PD-(D/E)XK nuclease superfamily